MIGKERRVSSCKEPGSAASISLVECVVELRLGYQVIRGIVAPARSDRIATLHLEKFRFLFEATQIISHRIQCTLEAKFAK